MQTNSSPTTTKTKGDNAALRRRSRSSREPSEVWLSSKIEDSRLRGKNSAEGGFDARTKKKDFPIFQNRLEPFVYLDSSATSQKPQQVIDAMTNFLTHNNANVHRGIYKLSDEATQAYESARATVAQFVGADSNEIIFTGNASEALNFIAYGWARKFLRNGDIVVLTDMEHHSNIVPWQRLRDEIGINLHWLPLNGNYRLDYQSLLRSSIDFKRVKLVSLSHTSNVLGTINPIADILVWLRSQTIDATLVVDAAQSVPHFKIDVNELGCDFLVFSSHKMLGPSGIGVLWGKPELLEAMDPFFVGSHMIKSVTKEETRYNDVPWKFEIGTGKLEAAVGLSAAIDYLNETGLDAIYKHDQMLARYGLEKLRDVKGLTLYGPQQASDRLAIFSFNIAGAHAHDVAQIFDRAGVCVRSGHHCAQPLMNVLGVPATVRASCYLYNDEKDIDALVEEIKLVKRTLRL